MTAHRTLVVDDERPARAKIIRLLAQDQRFDLVGEAVDGLEALRLIENLKPDLVILDIQMPRISGFEVLDALGSERSCAVIFSTAHDAHALRAFDAHAVDYLLKPYDSERFQRALDKARAQLISGAREREDGVTEVIADARLQNGREQIVVRTASGWLPLKLEAIVRVTAADKHVHVFADGEQHIVRGSLASMLARLSSKKFVRVHRSELINVDAIARFEPWEHGDGLIVLRDGSAVVLSRTFRKSFLEVFSG